MIITYPDDVTRSAILESIMTVYINQLSSTNLDLPRFRVVKGPTFKIQLEHHEELLTCPFTFAEFEKLIEKNMAF